MPRVIGQASVLAAAQPLEARQRLGIELVAQVAAGAIGVRRWSELTEEPARRELPHLGARRAPNSLVRRNDRNLLSTPMLGRQSLDRRVRIGRPPDEQRAVLRVLALPVEDE